MNTPNNEYQEACTALYSQTCIQDLAEGVLVASLHLHLKVYPAALRHIEAWDLHQKEALGCKAKQGSTRHN